MDPWPQSLLAEDVEPEDDELATLAKAERTEPLISTDAVERHFGIADSPDKHCDHLRKNESYP